MKTVVMLVAVLAACCFFVGGCSSGLLAGGGGAAAGLGLSNTIAGMQADLDQREAALVERYNNLIAAGAKAEDLAQVKEQIASIQMAKQGVGAVESVAATDWTDPKAAGGAIGTITALAYAFIKRRELVNTVAGVKTFRSNADEKVKHDLDSALIAKGVT